MSRTHPGAGREASEGAARIGFIVPSVNTVLEQDLHRYLPTGASAHVARWRTGRTVDLEAVLREVPEKAEELADASVDLIAFACTAASITGGVDASDRIRDAIESRCHVPSTTTAQALADAARHLGLRNVVYCGPFDGEDVSAEAQGFRSFGVHVVTTAGLGLTDALACSSTTANEVSQWAAQRDNPSADGMVLSCANLRAFESIVEIEGVLKKPVLSSNQALLWSVLRGTGIEGSVRGGGSLFDQSTT